MKSYKATVSLMQQYQSLYFYNFNEGKWIEKTSDLRQC